MSLSPLQPFADYKLAQVQEQKIKKSAQHMTLNLVRNPDILATISAMQQHRPFCVGFAAETRDVETYAKDKLQRKRLDMIAANQVGGSDGTHNAFNSDENALTVFFADGKRVELAQNSKQQLAGQLIQLIAEQLK